eukprot:1012509_1
MSKYNSLMSQFNAGNRRKRHKISPMLRQIETERNTLMANAEIQWIKQNMTNGNITSSSPWKVINNIVKGKTKHHDTYEPFAWYTLDGAIAAKGNQDKCDEYLIYYINKQKKKQQQTNIFDTETSDAMRSQIDSMWDQKHTQKQLNLQRNELNALHTLSNTKTFKRYILSQKKDKASISTDHISIKLLQKSIDTIAEPYSLWYNVSLISGHRSHRLNWRELTPHTKPGKDSKFIENQRPIGLTSDWSKPGDNLQNDKLAKYALKTKMITKRMYGGLKKLSSTLAVMDLLNDTKIVKKDTDILHHMFMIDIDGAFDCVNPTTLHYTLTIRMGISGFFIDWTQSILLNRWTRIKIKGYYSKWVKIDIGLTQGHTASMTLWICYTIEISFIVD